MKRTLSEMFPCKCFEIFQNNCYLELLLNFPLQISLLNLNKSVDIPRISKLID